MSAASGDKKAKVKKAAGNAAGKKAGKKGSGAQSAGSKPAGFRGHVEELRLQADLAAMGVRDDVRAQVEAAENAWLAARQRLEAAVGDAEGALQTLRGSLRGVLDDLGSAVGAADAAVKRSREKK
ncbi:MAG TPA: hypothetical protein VGR90_05205 [Acidimicrobiales bacterium]|nr:hypothetical protein [Acidimicrobiales bacterium]